jgi:hypothetical protein
MLLILVPRLLSLSATVVLLVPRSAPATLTEILAATAATLRSAPMFILGLLPAAAAAQTLLVPPGFPVWDKSTAAAV